jgi:hypothetical protein
MYVRYVGDNVDLDLLVSCLKKYFEEKKYKVEEIRKDEKRFLLCKIPNFPKGLEIIIEGYPEDFSVTTSFETGRFLSLLLYGLYSLFGGGIFILNEVKSKEFMSELEKDLRYSIERAVSLLTNTKKK